MTIKNNKRLKESENITQDIKLMFFENINRCRVIYRGLGYAIKPYNVFTRRGPIKTESNREGILKLNNNIISRLFGFDKNTYIYPERSSTIYGKVKQIFPEIEKMGQFNNTETYNIIRNMYKDFDEIFENKLKKIKNCANIHNILYNLLSCYIGTIEFEYYLESYTNILNYLKYELTHNTFKKRHQKISKKIYVALNIKWLILYSRVSFI